MIEVEAKVRLKKVDLDRLSKEVPTFAKPLGESLKVDRYYGSGAYDLRIREESGGSVLTFKARDRKQGIETNEEIEFPIEKPLVWDHFLRQNGFPLRAKKEKQSLAFGFKKFTIELNTVKGLGAFLEIECLVKDEAQVPKARKELTDLFHKMGFSPKDFERKLYLELLAEKRKNKTVR